MDVVVTWLSKIGDSSSAPGWHQNAMFIEQTVFVHASNNVSFRKDITHLEFGRLELPFLLSIERWDINTSGYEDGS